MVGMHVYLNPAPTLNLTLTLTLSLISIVPSTRSSSLLQSLQW